MAPKSITSTTAAATINTTTNVRPEVAPPTKFRSLLVSAEKFESSVGGEGLNSLLSDTEGSTRSRSIKNPFSRQNPTKEDIPATSNGNYNVHVHVYIIINLFCSLSSSSSCPSSPSSSTPSLSPSPSSSSL